MCSLLNLTIVIVLFLPLFSFLQGGVGWWQIHPGDNPLGNELRMACPKQNSGFRPFKKSGSVRRGYSLVG